MSDQSGFENSHYYALPVGTNLLEFRIEQVLGHGGFGITYLATDTNLDERVAIKEYLPNEIAVRVSDSTVRAKTKADSDNLEQGLNSFLEEARTIARFRHRNIVHVRRFFRLHGTAYIVLEYEYGQTLDQYLETDKMGNDQLRELLTGVLDGLDAVHKRATLHRDLKPSNIILRPDETPVLIDFGSARDFQSRNSKSVTAIATAGYSPPEQSIGGQQGPWTDLYALGAIAYRIVSGSTPPDSLRRLRRDPLVPASSLDVEYDPDILRTIDWMIKIDEAERPISVDAVRASLCEAISDAGQTRVDGPASGSEQNHKSASDGHSQSDAVTLGETSSRAQRPRSLISDVGVSVAIAGILSAIGFSFLTFDKERTSKPVSSSANTPVSSSLEKPRDASTAPAFTTTPSFYTTRFYEAGYDEQKLNTLLGLCRSDANCTANHMSAIDHRLSVILRESRQFEAARTPTEYKQYYLDCTACNYSVAALAKMTKVAPPPPPSSVDKMPKPERWHAVAHVSYKFLNQNRVSVGYSGIKSSPEEAMESAKSACERSSDGHECLVERVSDRGCYYIQTGYTPARWSLGHTMEEAQSGCLTDGYDCRGSPIGGCID
jgi:serine/threonine protein kinase